MMVGILSVRWQRNDSWLNDADTRCDLGINTLTMAGKLAKSAFDVHPRRPDFVVHVRVNENTTARLFAYRDTRPPVNAGGLVATGDEGRRAPVQSAGVGVGLGLVLNASIHNVGFSPVLVPSTMQENNDSSGF